jgi:hypothetical protein
MPYASLPNRLAAKGFYGPATPCRPHTGADVTSLVFETL